MLALVLACIALVAALVALAVAQHTWRAAPGARLWLELRNRIEDLEWDSAQLHERHHRRARQENVSKATEARVTKQRETGSVVDEAAAVLAKGAAAAPAVKGAPPGDGGERDLIYWRGRAGLH